MLPLALIQELNSGLGFKFMNTTEYYHDDILIAVDERFDLDTRHGRKLNIGDDTFVVCGYRILGKIVDGEITITQSVAVSLYPVSPYEAKSLYSLLRCK